MSTPNILLKAINYSGSGQWLDESGNGRNATLENGVIAKNTVGNGIVLDGSTNWTFPNIALGNAWTVNVWYKNTGARVGIAGAIVTQQYQGSNINLNIGYSPENVGGFSVGFYNVGWYTGTEFSGTITDNLNNWLNIQATWDGVNIKTYINGALIGTVALSSTTPDSGLPWRIGRRWDGPDYVVGEIGEVRIYDYALTQFQVTNDYKSSVPTFIWQPTQIPGCQLWFDSNDQSTITMSGSNITQWNDKSGSNNNTTTVTGSPTFSSTGVVFDGLSYFELPDGCIPYGNSSYSIYAVVKFDSFDAYSGYIGGGSNSNNECLCIRVQASGSINSYWYYNDLHTNTTVVVGVPFLFDSMYESGHNRTTFLFGSSSGSDTPGTRYQPNTGNFLGKTIDGPPMTGIISEILIYNTNHTTNQRQLIEGYLAWKWGLQTNLPSGHPFLNNPPTNKLVILLKAINYSGSGDWLDESGNGNNATLEDGIISKNISSNGIILDGSTCWTFPNLAVENSWSVNVWYKNTGSIQASCCIITQKYTGTVNLSISNLNNDSNEMVVGFIGSGSTGNSPPMGSNYYQGNDIISYITTGVWINIQGTWDGTNLNTYINGSLIGSLNLSGGTSIDNQSPYRIGRRWDSAVYMTGEIGEVRIYNYAISQTQVTTDYEASVSTFILPIPPPTSITNISLIITSNGFTITWSGGTNAASYTYTLNGSNTIPSTDNGVSSQSAVFTGLLAGTYTIVITAINITNSTASEPTIVTVQGVVILLKAIDYNETGDWLDQSGYGRNATLENGVIAKNTNGNGIILNGSTSWRFPNVAVGNAWTVNVWYKNTGGTSNNNSESCIITQNLENGCMNISWRTNGGYVGNGNTLVGFYNGSNWSNGSSYSFILNTWTNIQVTWDGTNIITYINSILLGSITPGGTSTDNGLPYYIGKQWGENNYMIGEIGEVRIYNYAISSDQVGIDYNESYPTYETTSSYTITNDRVYYHIIQDGKFGEAGRITANFDNFISINVFNTNQLSIMYYDIARRVIRYGYGRDPVMDFQDLITTNNPVIAMECITSFNNSNSYIIYLIDNQFNFNCYSNIITTSQLELANNSTNLKIKKAIGNNICIFIVSINNSIYQVTTLNSINIFTNIVDNDYDGRDYDLCIDSTNQIVYLAYTSANKTKIVSFSISDYTRNATNMNLGGNNLIITNIATLVDNSNIYSIPKLVIYNNILSLFVHNINDNNIYSTTIINSTKTIIIKARITVAVNYRIVVIESNLYIYYTKFDKKIYKLKFAYLLVNKSYNYNGQILNRLVQEAVSINYNTYSTATLNNIFDVTNISNEEYVYYIDNNNKLNQLWNPIPTTKINFSSVIVSLNCSVSNSGSAIYPSFDPSIYDYCINSNDTTNQITYDITINNINITNNIYPNQTITIIDSNNNIYHIKVLPSDIYLGTTIKYTNYIPGYYLTANTFLSSNYYMIYDSNGVPIWYKRSTSDGNLGIPQVCSLFLGDNYNTVVTDIFDTNRCRTLINVDTLDETNFFILPDSREGNPTWDVHEACILKAPLHRKGNMLLTSYTSSFYLQELSPTNTLVWDWFGSDYLNESNTEFYHINSADAHPITGHIVCSLRNCSAIISIDYNTGNIRWVINTSGQFISTLIDSTNVKILTPINEPTFPYSYNGTNAQHDARWHTNITPLTPGNEIISAFDDQSFTGAVARGVIYEIDLINSNAIFRGMVYSENGSSGYMGSYKIIDEPGGSTSHVTDWVQQHPCLGEYSSNNDTEKMPTQNKLFSLDLPGDHYRISKGTINDLSIDSMRKTSGMPFTTP